jgi:hypothetical protein
MFKSIVNIFNRDSTSKQTKIFVGAGFNYKENNISKLNNEQSYHHWRLIEEGDHKGKYQPGLVVTGRSKGGPITKIIDMQRVKEMQHIIDSGHEIYAPHPFNNN